MLLFGLVFILFHIRLSRSSEFQGVWTLNIVVKWVKLELLCEIPEAATRGVL